MTKAVIFDMDGVLVDSETWFLAQLADFIRSHGIEPDPKDLHALGGASMDDENRYLSKTLSVSEDEAQKLKQAWFNEHPWNYAPLLKPGVHEFLKLIHDCGYKCAVASSSPMASIQQMISQCGLEGQFDVVVSGEQFTRTKPDPEIYNYTVSALGVPASSVIVIEDSPIGIRAARAAGLYTVGLYDPNTDFDISQADLQIQTFSDLDEMIQA